MVTGGWGGVGGVVVVLGDGGGHIFPHCGQNWLLSFINEPQCGQYLIFLMVFQLARQT